MWLPTLWDLMLTNSAGCSPAPERSLCSLFSPCRLRGRKPRGNFGLCWDGASRVEGLAPAVGKGANPWGWDEMWATDCPQGCSLGSPAPKICPVGLDGPPASAGVSAQPWEAARAGRQPCPLPVTPGRNLELPVPCGGVLLQELPPSPWTLVGLTPCSSVFSPCAPQEREPPPVSCPRTLSHVMSLSYF